MIHLYAALNLAFIILCMEMSRVVHARRRKADQCLIKCLLRDQLLCGLRILAIGEMNGITVTDAIALGRVIAGQSGPGTRMPLKTQLMICLVILPYLEHIMCGYMLIRTSVIECTEIVLRIMDQSYAIK